MKTRVLLLLVLLLVAAGLAAVSVIFVPRTERAAEILEPPPEGYAAENDFSFKEVFEEGTVTDEAGNPATGVTRTLSHYAGRPAAVIFWASWSGASRNQLAAVEAIYAEYGDRAAILPVNVGKAGKDSEKKARIARADALEDGGYTFPLYVDKTGVVRFNVTSTPKTLFFDGMGNLVGQIDGLCDEETFREKLDGMLEE